jgi:hypothetical protein
MKRVLRRSRFRSSNFTFGPPKSRLPAAVRTKPLCDASCVCSLSNVLLALSSAPSQPAIKILDFFAGLAAADSAFRASGAAGADVEACGMTVTATEKAQAASAAFRDMPILDEKDAARWLGYWKTKGYFNELA